MSSKSKWSMAAKRKDDAFVGLGPRPQTKLQPIKEEPLPVSMIVMIREEQLEPGSRLFSMGQCSIIVSPPVEAGWGWHLSIAHPTRYPTWDEVAKARYELLPLDADFDMPLPRPENYVSIHSNCFHVWESGKQRSVR